jgi:hypothetical protein
MSLQDDVDAALDEPEDKSTGPACPFCASRHSKVRKSWNPLTRDERRRLRTCLACGEHFSSSEQALPPKVA